MKGVGIQGTRGRLILGKDQGQWESELTWERQQNCLEAVSFEIWGRELEFLVSS